MKTYHLQIDGQDVTATEDVLLHVHGRIAQLLSLETEEPWRMHVSEDLLSDEHYLQCERHGVIIHMAEIPDLGEGLLQIAYERHNGRP